MSCAYINDKGVRAQPKMSKPHLKMNQPHLETTKPQPKGQNWKQQDVACKKSLFNQTRALRQGKAIWSTATVSLFALTQSMHSKTAYRNKLKRYALPGYSHQS